MKTEKEIKNKIKELETLLDKAKDQLVEVNSSEIYLRRNTGTNKLIKEIKKIKSSIFFLKWVLK